MTDWKNRLDEEFEAVQQQRYLQAHTLPEIANREFFSLLQMLEEDARSLNGKYQNRIGRIDVERQDPNQIWIGKSDFPAYYVTMTLSVDGKQISVEREIKRSLSQTKAFRPMVFELDIDSQNNLLIRHNGDHISLEQVSEMFLKPIILSAEFFEN